MQILLEGRNPQEIRAQVLQLFPDIEKPSLGANLPPLEEASEKIWGDWVHTKESDGTDVEMVDMHPRHLLNLIARDARRLRRDEDITPELQAAVYHLWRKLAQEELEENGL